MKRNTIDLFLDYQRCVILAYENLRAGDNEGYTQGLYQANKLSQRAKQKLNRADFALYTLFTDRTVDVLRKCVSLGLSNIEKRLKEFCLSETMTTLLNEKSIRRRRKLQRDPSFLLAA